MDLTSKKRKADDNVAVASPSPRLTPEDAAKILESFSRDQLLSIVSSSMVNDPSSSSVLASVRAVADADPTKRKLFIRGLGWDTTTESIRSIFSAFGELDEAVVICDKQTGKSKGYGFITFKHVDGALLALKEPSKKIDGRMTVTQLAAAGNTGGPPTGPVVPAPDVALRKIYVGSVPHDMSSDRLLALFSSFGEIEEGPLGFDKQTGKFRGYALFVYKNAESARAAIEEPTKFIDGHQIFCKLANDSKKGKPDGPPGVDTKFGETPFPGSMASQYGGPGSGLSNYGGFSGATGFPSHHNVNAPPLQSSIVSGLSSVGSQPPSALPGLGAGGAGGYGSGFGGAYGSSSQYLGSGGYGGLGMAMGSGLYDRTQSSSGGMGAGPGSGGYPEGGRGYPDGGRGYPEGGPYSLPSKGYTGPHHQQPGSPPGARVPPGGGMYQGMSHYF